MKQVHLVVLSPEQTLFDGEVESVTLPGTCGSFTVLPNHAPVISSLEAGAVEYVSGGERKSLEIKSGFIEFKKNEMTVCVE